jgi:hypothetical protein
MGSEMRPWPKFFVQTVIGYALLAPVALLVGLTGLIYEGFETAIALALYSWLGILGILLGIVILIFSYSFGGKKAVDLEGVSYTMFVYTMFVPNGWLLLTGGVVLAFFATHTWISIGHLRILAQTLKRAAVSRHKTHAPAV